MLKVLNRLSFICQFIKLHSRHSWAGKERKSVVHSLICIVWNFSKDYRDESSIKQPLAKKIDLSLNTINIKQWFSFLRNLFQVRSFRGTHIAILENFKSICRKLALSCSRNTCTCIPNPIIRKRIHAHKMISHILLSERRQLRLTDLLTLRECVKDAQQVNVITNLQMSIL